MNFERYSERSRSLISTAQTQAITAGHQQLTPEHLLKALLEDDDCLAINLLSAAGGRPEQVLELVEAALAKLPCVEGGGGGQLYMAPETARILERAGVIAEQAGDRFVTAERLLQALTEAKGSTGARLLGDAGVTVEALGSAIERLRKGRKADSENAEDSYDALDRYANDITEMARAGKLDP
ncbi:MAG TPA: Clp protease N-terminal domain-containing protein, partial [Alphaproteobacteria bacterium]|nr:Clp protease N-terminal domain-containing protein [Alphaproteobacteria bacterium]